MLKITALQNHKNRLAIDLGIIFFCALLITLPLYLWGIPDGQDMSQHFQFAGTYYHSIMNGDFYPSWSADTNYGYGDVGVRFYPPLTYYVLSFFRLLSGNWYEGACLAIAFFFFISGVGTYFWARQWFSENASLIGALFYLIAPYHLIQIYQATLIAEFAAASIIPFCFLFVTRVCERGKQTDICGLGLSIGLLILTHLPTTVMAFFALSIYVLFSLKKNNFIQSILKLSGAGLLGAVLSSFYWMRMITELDWVKHNSEAYSSGYFSFQSHFAFTFLAQIFGVDLISKNNFINNLLLVTLGVLISSLILHFLNAKEKKIHPLTNVFAMTAFSLFMVLPFSLFIWEKVSVLQKIQFPWRWTIFVSLGCAVFVAASFEVIISYLKTSRRYLSILAIGLLFICLSFDALKVVNHIFYMPKDFFIGMTERVKTNYSNDCWWTVWVPTNYFNEHSPKATKFIMIEDKVVIDGRKFEIKSWQSTTRNFVIDAGNAGNVTVATMYYPHWKATVNGQPVEVTYNETGLISLSAPAEKSEIKLYFQEPPHVIAAFYISGFAWIIMLGLLSFYLIQSIKNKKS